MTEPVNVVIWSILTIYFLVTSAILCQQLYTWYISKDETHWKKTSGVIYEVKTYLALNGFQRLYSPIHHDLPSKVVQENKWAFVNWDKQYGPFFIDVHYQYKIEGKEYRNTCTFKEMRHGECALYHRLRGATMIEVLYNNKHHDTSKLAMNGNVKLFNNIRLASIMLVLGLLFTFSFMVPFIHHDAVAPLLLTWTSIYILQVMDIFSQPYLSEKVHILERTNIKEGDAVILLKNDKLHQTQRVGNIYTCRGFMGCHILLTTNIPGETVSCHLSNVLKVEHYENRTLDESNLQEKLQ